MITDTQRVLLKESLGLLATYAWHHKVALLPATIENSAEAAELSVEDFGREFRMRHAIAAAQRLVPILEAIEARPSHESYLVRDSSRGWVRGRLDVPRYISRRSALRTYPRSYPIVRNDLSYATTENLLARIALHEVRTAIRDNPFPRSSAESVAAADLLRWTNERLRRRLWGDLAPSGRTERLRNETAARVRRRQTGNDSAYARLVSWFGEWSLEVERLGGTQQDELVEALLAFPTGDAFWEKVFEVWCLVEVGRAIDSLGWQRMSGPRPLHRKGTPVFVYTTPDFREVQVMFQRQIPPDLSHWTYRAGRVLRGIPDITIADDRGTRLIVDAKYRFVGGEVFTRSEETYKMLGYAENFRSDDGTNPFRGVLIFPSDVSSGRILDGPENGRLDLVSVNVVGDRSMAYQQLSDSLTEWATTS